MTTELFPNTHQVIAELLAEYEGPDGPLDKEKAELCQAAIVELTTASVLLLATNSPEEIRQIMAGGETNVE